MMTIKLMKKISHSPGDGEAMAGRFTTKIVEAEEVQIHVLRPGELVEVASEKEAFYVADPNQPRPQGFAAEIDFWFSAFVENSRGSTVEVVKF